MNTQEIVQVLRGMGNEINHDETCLDAATLIEAQAAREKVLFTALFDLVESEGIIEMLHRKLGHYYLNIALDKARAALQPEVKS